MSWQSSTFPELLVKGLVGIDWCGVALDLPLTALGGITASTIMRLVGVLSNYPG